MKKRILLIAGLIYFGIGMSFSQSLSLIYEGNPIPANEEIIFEGVANGNTMVFEVQVTNNSTNSLNVLVKKVENYLLEGTVNTFCWAGQCYGPDTYVSPNSSTIPAGGTTPPGAFSGDYNPGTIIGQSSISYVFFDQNNVNDSVMVTVLFTCNTTGIGNNNEPVYSISEPYPNPARQIVKFDYDLKDSGIATLKIYSLVGSVVEEVQITEKTGIIQVNTDRYQEGFYFYTFSANGKNLTTGRFIVNR